MQIACPSFSVHLNNSTKFTKVSPEIGLFLDTNWPNFAPTKTVPLQHAAMSVSVVRHLGVKWWAGELNKGIYVIP